MSRFEQHRDQALHHLDIAYDGDPLAEASEAHAIALVHAVLALAEAVRETGNPDRLHETLRQVAP